MYNSKNHVVCLEEGGTVLMTLEEQVLVNVLHYLERYAIEQGFPCSFSLQRFFDLYGVISNIVQEITDKKALIDTTKPSET